MWIELDGRRFIVAFDAAGSVWAIKERKTWMPGTFHECFYDAPYWHRCQRRPLRGLAARILAEAERRHAQG